jgi:hypothetical protein
MQLLSQSLDSLVEVAPRRLGRAAQRGADLGVGEVAGKAQRDGGALLRRQGADRVPDLGPGVDPAEAGLAGRRLHRCHLGHLGNRQGAASVGAVMVDCLAVGDGQQPAAQVAGVAQLRVGAQRGEEGLLEAVLRIAAADGPSQDRHHLGGVLVEQGLKRGQGGQVTDKGTVGSRH